MAAKKFLLSTLALTLTSTALRLVGMGYRIYISQQIGAAGMGLYQLIMSVYALCKTFATAGLSVALTRLIGRQCSCGSRAGVRRILSSTLCWSALMGAMIGSVMFFGAGGLAGALVKQPAAASSFRILAFGMPFMAMSACFSGYFLARGRVGGMCLAQVAEQVARIGFVVLALDTAKDVPAQCHTIFTGNFLSEIVCCGTLFILYKADFARLTCPQTRPFGDRFFGAFLAIVLPIAGTKCLTGFLHTAENLLVPVQIEKFTHDNATALSAFGALKGMALPVLMFPSSFLSTVGALLIPEISDAHVLRRADKIAALTQKALRITFVPSLLIGGVFFTFAEPIARLLYKSDEVAYMLRFLAPVVPFMYLDCIADSLLKGLGQQMSTLRYNMLDSSLRITLLFLLVPHSGINGFLIIMLISNTLVSVLELIRLLRVSEAKLPVKEIAFSLIAVLLGHLLCSPLLRGKSGILPLLLPGTLYLAVFAAVLFLGGIRLPKRNH